MENLAPPAGESVEGERVFFSVGAERAARFMKLTSVTVTFDPLLLLICFHCSTHELILLLINHPLWRSRLCSD